MPKQPPIPERKPKSARVQAANQDAASAVERTDLSALLMPKNSVMTAVEQALLRGQGAHASPPIAEQIAARLAGLIALDLLHPGQRLFELDVSEVLHVSRSPVREAIRILERDRLIELHTRRGATVTAPNARELHDIFEVRAALFAILLEQVMRDRPADLEAVFDKFMPQLLEAAEKSPEAYALQSFLLNLAIIDLCSNRLVVDQLKSIALRTLRYVRLGLGAEPESLPRSIKAWRSFRAGVIKRDVPLVLDLAAKQIATIRNLSVSAVGKSQP